MLDINFIKENKEKVLAAVKNKQLEGTVDIEALIQAHNDYLEVLKRVETNRSSRNKLSEEVSRASAEERPSLVEKAKEIKEVLQKDETELSDLKAKFDALMLWVPNVPAEDVPVGENESGNVVVKEVGEKREFNFTPKDHADLGKSLDIIDTERGVKIAGFRGYFLKNEGADLEQAVLKYAIDIMKSKGFTFMTVPWMVNPEYFLGTGYFPWGEDDHYRVQDNQALIGTAEVSLTSYYANEVLTEDMLPVKMVGVSPCFRREIGTYGKDTKGIFRLHQFTKVEQVVLTKNDEAETRKMHDEMLSYSEEVLKGLNLPYRVLLMCTGDMGPGQRRKYDIETWVPSQNAYRETHSDSYFLDFQARRLNIKYKTKEGKLEYVYTLNNTVVASPRILIPILENYQQEDGSIIVPEALRKYTGFSEIKPPKR